MSGTEFRKDISFPAGWLYGVFPPLGIMAAMGYLAHGSRRRAFQALVCGWGTWFVYLNLHLLERLPLLVRSVGLATSLVLPVITLVYLRRLEWPKATPLKTVPWATTGVVIVVLAGFIGIMAMIAIPQYQMREVYSRISQVMHRVQLLRAAVEEHVRKTGRLPKTPSEISGAMPIKAGNAADSATARLGDDGVIVVRFEPTAASPLAGTTVELVPVLENDELSWRCDRGTLAPRYRSGRCWLYISSDVAFAQSYKRYQGPSNLLLARLDVVDRVMREIRPLRLRVQEHILRRGIIPASASEVPDSAPIVVPGVAVAQLQNNGVIQIRFEHSVGKPLAGNTVEFTPVIEGNRLSWRCDRGTVPPGYRSTTCWFY